MNRTNLEHLGYGLIMLLLIGLPSGNWFAGAAFASAWFISREYTQREYKLFVYGQNETKRYKVWEPFLGWSLDAYLDALLPSVVTLGIAFILWMMS